MEFKAGLLYSFLGMWYLSQQELHIRFITYIAVSKWPKILFLQSMLNTVSGLLRNSVICHRLTPIMKINYRWRMLSTMQWKMQLLCWKPANPVSANRRGPRDALTPVHWTWITGSCSNSSGRIPVDFEIHVTSSSFLNCTQLVRVLCLMYISSVYTH